MVLIGSQASEPIICMCDYDICAMTTGIYEGGPWLDHIKSNPNVIECKAYPEPGTHVKGADTGLPEWYVPRGAPCVQRCA